MDKLRARFEKTGKAVYISHLDLMRVVQRVFLRAEVPIKYSEGFNPHALISICLPLGVGTASVAELMDFRVTRDVPLKELPERLNAVSPEGLKFLECYEPWRKAADIKWLRFAFSMDFDNRDAALFVRPLEQFFARESIEVLRKTKRGEGTLDLAPQLKDFTVTLVEGETLSGEVTLSAQEPTVKPELITEALRQLAPNLSPNFARFTRLETYDKNLTVFR